MNIDVVSTVRPAARPASGRPQDAAAPVDVGVGRGKDLPPAGNEPPPVKAKPIEPPDFSALVARLNQYLQESKRGMRFQVDEGSGRTVITVLDGAGQVIRQIPSEELLALSQRLAQGAAPSFVDVRA